MNEKKIEDFLFNASNILTKKKSIDAEDLKKIIYIYCNSSIVLERELAQRILSSIDQNTNISVKTDYNELLKIYANEYINKSLGVN